MNTILPPRHVTLEDIRAGLHRRFADRLQDRTILHIVIPTAWAERIYRLLNRGDSEGYRRMRTPDDLHDLLLRLWEYMDNRTDVVDGDYGEPRPNTEMGLAQEIDQAIQYVTAQMKEKAQ